MNNLDFDLKRWMEAYVYETVTYSHQTMSMRGSVSSLYYKTVIIIT